jgi:hypothetical protein
MAANQNYQKAPSQEMLNAAREQQVINARIVAIDKALELARISNNPAVDGLLQDAQKIAEYLIGDVQALKPKSSIIQQVNLPPEGMFKPGH